LKFLCLVYAEQDRLATLSGAEWDALIAENLALCDDLRRSGHFVSAAPLDRVETATTVRVRDGKAATTDGPFAETKEQLGGFYLIEARDRTEAIRIAGRIPGARHGSVEVRRLLAHDPRVPWRPWSWTRRRRAGGKAAGGRRRTGRAGRTRRAAASTGSGRRRPSSRRRA
jgi:hypothetical protein